MDLNMSDLLREAAGDGAARSDTRATTPEHDGTFSYGFVRTQGTPPEHGEEQAAASMQVDGQQAEAPAGEAPAGEAPQAPEASA
jgi:hypothetical protein